MRNVQFDSYLKISQALLLTGLVAAIGILCWVPPVSRDALTHHLAVPKLYLQHGGIYEIPAVVFSYYPMNLDLLYMIPLSLGNDIAPKFIHFFFALLSAGLIYSYLKKRMGIPWGLCGALFFLSLPIVVKLSITVYVDLGLVFFSTASIMCLLKWIELRFALRWLVFAALFCGLALGTKYNGLIVLFLLTIFVPFIYVNRKKHCNGDEEKIGRRDSTRMQLKGVGMAVFFCFMALLVFSPWMIRNYIWQSNPVYPLYNSWFHSTTDRQNAAVSTPHENKSFETREIVARKSSGGWSTFAVRKVLFHESWWEIMLIPLRIFFQGQDDNPRYFDGKLNPFLFFLPLFAFWPSKFQPTGIKTEKKIWAVFAVLFLLYAFSQSAIRIRYIAPIIPPLVILAVYGLKNIMDMGASRQNSVAAYLLRGVGISAAVAMLVINGEYIYQQFNYVRPIPYITGQISRDAYIARYRTEYPVIQYANQHLRNDARILAVFLGNRRYYSDRDIVFGNALLRKLIHEADSAHRISRELKKKGLNHILVRYDLFSRWSASQFHDRERQRIRDLFSRHAKLVIENGGYGLFELK